MKIGRILTDEEVKAVVPSGLIDALNADPADVIYCMDCDGMRLKNHEHGGLFYEWLKKQQAPGA